MAGKKPPIRNQLTGFNQNNHKAENKIQIHALELTNLWLENLGQFKKIEMSVSKVTLYFDVDLRFFWQPKGRLPANRFSFIQGKFSNCQ